MDFSQLSVREISHRTAMVESLLLEPDSRPSSPVHLQRLAVQKQKSAKRKAKYERWDGWRTSGIEDVSGDEAADPDRVYSRVTSYTGDHCDSFSNSIATPATEPISKGSFDPESISFARTMKPCPNSGPGGSQIDTVELSSTSLERIDSHRYVSAQPASMMDNIIEVFKEQLPDPVFLEQVVGTCNGEIRFIQHPNRDVTAHQWDSVKFEWVNIGGYSCRLKRIVGQLASDTLRGQTVTSSVPRDTMRYFHAVAKQREKMAFTANSVKTDMQNSNIQKLSSGNMISQSILAKALSKANVEDTAMRPKLHPAMNEQFGSLSSVSGPSSECGFPTLNVIGNGSRNSLRVPVHSYQRTSMNTNQPTSSIAKLPDPFVTSQKPTETLSLYDPRVDSRHGENRIGNADSHFQFSVDSSIGTKNDGMQDRRHMIEAPERSRIQTDLWPQQRHGQSQLNENTSMPTGISLCSNSHFVHNRAAIAHQIDLGQQQAFTRQHQPSSPNTEQSLSNSHGTGTLANKHLYNQGEYGRTNIKSSMFPLTLNLIGSIPDDTPKHQMHEIVSSLSKEKPTPQTWNGPFFENDIPTAHRPSAHLAHHKTDEEKLNDWWSSGHLYNRQESFYQTITKTMNPIKGDEHNQVTTRFLIPIYENLAAYVHQGRTKTYFAR